MKHPKLLFCSLALGLAGCVQSHQRPPVVYTPAPVAVEPPVVATSSRPVERVYPAPASASARDLAIADSVRSVMRGEVVIPSVGNNVQARVENGVVTLIGTVPTERDQDEMVNRIAKIPGVLEVRDRTTVTLK